MKRLRSLCCFVVVLLMMCGGTLWAAKIVVEETSSKEAKPEALIVPMEERERQARLERQLAIRARREAHDKKLNQQDTFVDGTPSSIWA